MYNGEIINDLLKNSKREKKELMEAMGWKSYTQFRQSVVGNPSAETLEKIADFFRVPIDVLFDRQAAYSTNPLMLKVFECKSAKGKEALLQERVLALQDLVEEKDKRLALLEDYVESLKAQIGQKS